MKKKYEEILLHYRWHFIKGDIFIGEWGIFGVGIFLCYSRFFIKGDFIIGRVECTWLPLEMTYNQRAWIKRDDTSYIFML